MLWLNLNSIKFFKMSCGGYHYIIEFRDGVGMVVLPNGSLDSYVKHSIYTPLGEAKEGQCA